MKRALLLLTCMLVMGCMATVEARAAHMSSPRRAMVFMAGIIDYRILSEEDKTVEVVSILSQEADSVTIPETVTYNEVTYTVTAIAGNAASRVEGMETLSLPSTLKRIGKNAFGLCFSLKSVTLPEGLEEVGEQAFCDSPIDHIHIPASVSHLGSLAFKSASLESITVAADNAVYDSREDCNAVVEKSTGKLVLGCNNTKIPASVKIIGPSALYGCKSLASVDLPEGLTEIGNSAFYNCTGLQELELPHSLISIGNAAFLHCTGIKELTIPRLVEHIGEEALGVSENALLSVENGNPCYDSREDCNAIIETTTNRLIKGSNKSRIPSTVTSIGVGAFMSCTGVTEVDLPNGLTVIEREAFDGCKNLVRVSLPQSLTTIGDGAFGYTAIKEMELPSLVNSIGNYAFSSCRQLEQVKMPETVAHFGDNMFGCCESLKKVNLPSGLTKVGKSMFSYCRSLTHVEIPSSVSSIEYQAFYQCSALQTVNFPDSLETIGSSAFYGCSSLEQVSLPNTVRAIQSNAFDRCTSLSKITLGNQLETIGWEAFQFSKIKKITLPATLRKCGQYLLAYCDQLTSITVLAVTPPRFEYDWGTMVPKVKFETVTLYVPAGSVDAYRSAAEWKNFNNIVAIPDLDVYRPFVEEDKVWKVGDYSGNPVQRVEYYYFDGDTIIDGKNCKQMMCQRYVNAEHPDYANISQLPSLSYVGAWYEEGKKVYFYDPTTNQFKLMYDFSLDANAPLQIHGQSYVIGPKQTDGIKGFKGVYRDVMMKWDEEESIYNTTWLEGVGGIDGPTVSVYSGEVNHGVFLMSCTVGDEVIYLNDEYEDGATPGDLEAKKHRFDFTHTVKNQPKAPIKRVKSDAESSETQSLYGEYNERQLGINLNPLDDAYIVRIANESGNVVYEKAVIAGSIVALSINISAYAKGRYTVTVENSSESFSGEFDTQTTGIKEVGRDATKAVQYYSIDGKRIATPQPGLNIIRTSDGTTKKVVVN